MTRYSKAISRQAGKLRRKPKQRKCFFEPLEDRRLLTTLLASDDFESGDFSGGAAQWSSGGWTDLGDTSIQSGGAGSSSYQALLRDESGYLSRSVDTSGMSSATLSFSSRLYSLEGGDKGVVQISTDGSNWTTVKEFVNGDDDNVYRDHEVEITDLSDTLHIRFDAQMSQSGWWIWTNHDDWYVDNVEIIGTPDGPPEISISDATATEGDIVIAGSAGDFVSAGSGGLDRPRGITFGPDGNLYVASVETDSVLRYDGETGAFLDEFVSPGSGGLDAPRDVVFDSNGQLLVASGKNDRIIRYNGVDGSFDSVLVDGTGGLNNPQNIAYINATNELFVSSAESDEILKYEGQTGDFVGTFVTAGSGGLSNPKWHLFTDTGDLLVVSQLGDEILKYSASGVFEGVFYAVPAQEASTTILMGMTWGPDGNLLVAEDNDLNPGRVIRLDADSGAFIDESVPSGDGGLNSPRSISTDAEGNLYVVSYETDEVLRYAPAANAVFTVSLSAPSELPVSVDFDTSDGTATAGSDYKAMTGTLVFEPGVTSRTIIVPTMDDLEQEPDETFEVTLSSAVGATITDSQGVGTILDDGDPANQPPVADDDAYTIAEDSVLNTAAPGVLDGDSDPENDTLTVALVADPGHGAVTLNADGSFTYTPSSDYAGPDSFTYRANDGTSDSNTATVNITVTAVNDAPTADSQTVSLKENTDKSITLSASDIEGDSLTYSVQTGPTSGSLSGTAPNLVYTPDTGFTGADSFTFVANDGELDSNVAIVTINVAENVAPVANSQAVSVNEDGSLAITLTGSDADGDPITYSVASFPINGTLTGTEPNLNYAPNGDFHGSDSFTFKVNDGTNDSAEATVSITVNPVNDIPTADGQSQSADEDTPLAVTLTGGDIDGDSLTFHVVESPSNGTLSGTAPDLTYTPNGDFHGADSLTFVANDGTSDSAEATVSITVDPVNDVPVADDQSVTTNQDTALDITLTGSDVDEDPLNFTIATQPGHGILSGSAPDLMYTPDTGYSGPDSFTFVANDGAVDSAEASVSLDVTPVVSGPKLSYGVVSGVNSSGWTTVTLGESYSSMVVIATPNYDSSDDPGVTRIRNAVGNSFEVRIDAVGGAAFSGIDVHYVVVEEGVYTEAEHGVAMEAVKFTSTVTDENNSWVGQARSYANTYSDPVVVGQVMSYNDPDWSVFWAHDGSRTSPPSSTALVVGKEVAEDGDTTRADETIGYLVIESGSGSVGETAFAAAVGADSVRGITDSPPFAYSVIGVPNPTAAVASTAGMDGGNGGWPLLYGNAPVASGALQLAYDEDVIGDTERNHTSEQVACLVFGEAAQTAKPQLRHGIITLDSDDGWQTVTLDHTYDSMVIVATPNYDSTPAPASVRIQNAVGNSFEIRVDPAGGGSVSGIDVHYVVVEEGVYNDAGVKMEAVRFDTSAFDRKGSWSGEVRGYSQLYTDPVVVGQVMSYNDPGFSEFWANGGSQGAIPTSSDLRVGRHIGEDPNYASRPSVSEKIGYLVIESTNSGTIEGLPFVAGVGGDIVRGMTNGPSFDYTYSAMDNSKTAIATLAAMDGGDGGWAVLYGTDPITPTGSTLRLAVDEDQLGDSERGHTTEQVAYFIIDPPVDAAPAASDALDVNLDGFVTPMATSMDAMLVANWLNSSQGDEGPNSVDLDDGGQVTPTNTFVEVNYLNEHSLTLARETPAVASRALDQLLASLAEDEEEGLLEDELLDLLI